MFANNVRSVREIREDLRRRAGKQNPVRMFTPQEVEAAISGLTEITPESWAALWSEPGDFHWRQAEAAENSGREAEARDHYLKAYAYFAAARYPHLFGRGMEAAYRKGVQAYQRAGRYFDPPLQVVHIPFEGKEIVGYLRLPEREGKLPLVFHWGGIDGWKEERHGNTQTYLAQGFASFSIDGPGTGECPVLASPAAERVFSAALDFACSHPRVDTRRIAVVGSSFGGYWAAKVAHVEAERLCGAVNWGGGVHFFFREAWQRRSRSASSYLFGLCETRAKIFGITDVEEFFAGCSSLSLLDQGCLDRPCAPLLLVNGKKDEQVPIEDLYLLLERGNPKTARVFSEAGHMGPAPDALRTVVGWLRRRLEE